MQFTNENTCRHHLKVEVVFTTSRGCADSPEKSEVSQKLFDLRVQLATSGVYFFDNVGINMPTFYISVFIPCIQMYKNKIIIRKFVLFVCECETAFECRLESLTTDLLIRHVWCSVASRLVRYKSL